MPCPHHSFLLPIDTTNYLLIYKDKGKVAINILPKIIAKRHNMKYKVYFQFSITVYLGCTPPWCIKLSCNNSLLLCFLVEESNTALFKKLHNFWHRSFQNSTTFIRVFCFSNSELQASYIPITIFEYLNHSCHDIVCTPPPVCWGWLNLLPNFQK